MICETEAETEGARGVSLAWMRTGWRTLALRCDLGEGPLLTQMVETAEARSRDQPVDSLLREDPPFIAPGGGPCPNCARRGDHFCAKGQDRESASGQFDGWFLGIVQNLKTEEHVVMTKGARARSAHVALRDPTRRSQLAGAPNMVMRYCGADKRGIAHLLMASLYLISGLWRSRARVQFKCNLFRAAVQDAILSGITAFTGMQGSITTAEPLPLDTCRLARLLAAQRAVRASTGKMQRREAVQPRRCQPR